ncbi:MAG TPA: hypothetical protein VNH18_04825 [Bryobacteraceae bacterium]|nr:hypothetical protein [Bryobacteraceae bacterium]
MPVTSTPAPVEAPIFARLRSLATRYRAQVRAILLLYLLLLACPIRYWPLENNIDPTWRFALNFAAAHDYAAGRDFVYTMGPLAYLMLPQNIGSNLERALIFQVCLWFVLAAIFADVFFRGNFRVRNLALFCFCFSLAAPLFWFNSMGSENLILAGVCLLLLMYHRIGSWIRYCGALLLIGMLPLFKASAGLIGFAALAGFLAERIIGRRPHVSRELLLAALVPIPVFSAFCLYLLPSVSVFLKFLRGSAEVMSGYSSAMMWTGPDYELLLAAEAAGVLAVFLHLQSLRMRLQARFLILVLALPVLISLKHGFVRQDEHVANYFCFIALCLAAVSLTLKLGSAKTRVLFCFILVVFCAIWQGTVGWRPGAPVRDLWSGQKAAAMLSGILPFDRRQERLDAAAADFPAKFRLEPALVARIGTASVASLSNNFTPLAAAGLHLSLIPTLQRCMGYTPWLDRLNAEWVREKGPRYLVFDGQAIDHRDPWAETPAMWLEIYKWYDTRMLGARDLLLERRATPRFNALETIGHLQTGLAGQIPVPVSNGLVFWTMKCEYTAPGLIRKTLARIPPVGMSVHETGGTTRPARRILPEVLVSPVLGNYLPDTLARFAALFGEGPDRAAAIDNIRFDGEGAAAYSPVCEVALLRPVL